MKLKDIEIRREELKVRKGHNPNVRRSQVHRNKKRKTRQELKRELRREQY